ncbi:hypothetical protein METBISCDRAFT_25272 [Metschnikowia bicuspidata]|uniref:CoA-binding domain-containing protein n=1 Tax=Metschnikowia bicuspidata TaxID=27322 RepID=A0A4P9ZKJ8_9ASCO|nr:hypothetical protein METBISCDRAFT_25272 [Metschnikowia bicuspidata]
MATFKNFFGSDREYFGIKIFSWYVSHELSVILINPREEILGQKVMASIKRVLAALAEKKNIAHHKLSAADDTLDEISGVLGYKAYDQAALEKVAAIGLEDKTVHEDECILVQGESGLYRSNL